MQKIYRYAVIIIILLYEVHTTSCNNSERQHRTYDDENSKNESNSSKESNKVDSPLKPSVDSPAERPNDNYGSTNSTKKIIGEWNINETRNITDDKHSTLNVKGSITFNSDNIYNMYTTITMSVYIENKDMNVPLSFTYEENGKWSVESNILKQVVTKNRLTAENNYAKKFQDENPDDNFFKAIPLENTELHYKIQTLTDNLLDIISSENEEIVYRKN